jgi:hypothetical protein
MLRVVFAGLGCVGHHGTGVGLFIGRGVVTGLGGVGNLALGVSGSGGQESDYSYSSGAASRSESEQHDEGKERCEQLG